MAHKTLEELAELCGATLEGEAGRSVRGPATLSQAGPEDVAFLAHPKYVGQLEHTRAAAVLVRTDQVVSRPDLALLRCADPGRAFTAVVRAFDEPIPAPSPGVHASAVVDPSARVEPGAIVGPGSVIEADAVVEQGAVLRAGVYLGHGARVGARTVLEPGVTLYARTEVGADCLVHAGAVLGADGFGFELVDGGWEKIPQCGNVVVEDGVEIGANCTVDRARFGATRIGRGAKLDNLVHVAHNVQVGAGSLLIAQSGVAGSSELGPGVVLAGQAGVSGHVRLASGVRVGAQGGVYGDLLEPGDYTGTPARPRMEWLRAQAGARQVDRIKDRLARLESRLASLEGGGR